MTKRTLAIITVLLFATVAAAQFIPPTYYGRGRHPQHMPYIYGASFDGLPRVTAIFQDCRFYNVDVSTVDDWGQGQFYRCHFTGDPPPTGRYVFQSKTWGWDD